MENSMGFYVSNEVDKKQLIQDAIKEYSTGMSLVCDDLIEKAKEETNTMDEYISYLKGAAFIFYCVARRNNPQQYGTPEVVTTPQQSIEHVIRLIPFMEESEKIEHLRLVGWLNELLVRRGEKAVPLPKQYLSDKEIQDSINAYTSKLHHKYGEYFHNWIPSIGTELKKDIHK